MNTLDPDILHVKYLDGIEVNDFSLPRRYTLTHSDSTGHMFLGIGRNYCKEQISGLYTRFMRDEVLAEWKKYGDDYQLHVLCHVSGGLIFGSRRMRLAIFKQHMPLVLEALRCGDRGIYERCPELNRSRILVHFCSRDPATDRIQGYGSISDFS